MIGNTDGVILLFDSYVYSPLANLELQVEENGVLFFLPIEEFRRIEGFLSVFLIVFASRNMLLNLFVFQILLIGFPKSVDCLEVSFDFSLHTFILAGGDCSIDEWFECALF